MLNAPMLDFSNGQPQPGFVERATDPNVLPQPYSQPADFTAQYPTPLDTTEIIAMCDEVRLWQAIPEYEGALNQEFWRELNSLAFTSGTSYISFATGECPDEFTHGGTNTTVTLKNIGAKKSLARNDIKHSAAIAAANWNGINALNGPLPSTAGQPGGSAEASMMMATVADVMEKETALATVLTMNGGDRLLAVGDVSGNSLEYDGIENLVTAANGSYVNSSSPSGTFSAQTYDRFLADSCAKPTHVFGHPSATQEMQSGFLQLGFQGSQLVNHEGGAGVTPGITYTSFVNTGIGRLEIVSDTNFTRSNAGGGNFLGTLFGLRMQHNGVPLVYKRMQFPLSFENLLPGCTAVSFQVWARLALIIKHKCAHSRFTSLMSGNIVTTCPTIG